MVTGFVQIIFFSITCAIGKHRDSYCFGIHETWIQNGPYPFNAMVLNDQAMSRVPSPFFQKLFWTRTKRWIKTVSCLFNIVWHINCSDATFKRWHTYPQTHGQSYHGIILAFSRHFCPQQLVQKWNDFVRTGRVSIAQPYFELTLVRGHQNCKTAWTSERFSPT